MGEWLKIMGVVLSGFCLGFLAVIAIFPESGSARKPPGSAPVTLPHRPPTAAVEPPVRAAPTQMRAPRPEPPSRIAAPGDRARTDKGPVTIVAVGDIMLGGSVHHAYPTGGGELGPALDPFVRSVLRSGDVTLGNLEGAIVDGVAPTKRCKTGRCYSFRMPLAAARRLAESGFDYVNLANNHAGDFGVEGLRSTLVQLRRAGLAAAGLDRDCCRTVRMTVRGVEIGFTGFAPHGGSLNLLDRRAAARVVRELSSTADIAVVAFHGGAEGAGHQNVPRAPERFLNAERGDVFAFARAMVDAGADLVVGSGPHVPRAIEVYKDRLIAYSLGNFWTVRDFNLRGASALAPILEARLEPDGGLERFTVYSARQSGGAGPKPDPRQTAWRSIEALTGGDFPEFEISAWANR